MLRHSLKQDVAHLQDAKDEAVKRADEAVTNSQERRSLQDSEHNTALQELAASKVSHMLAWL